MALDEEDIAGEDGAVRGHVNDHVPLGMGGPHLLQMHRFASHGEGAFHLKGFRGQALLHAFEIEGAKAVNAAAGGGLDDVIDPADTREWIAQSMSRLPAPAPRSEKKYPYINTW